MTVLDLIIKLTEYPIDATVCYNEQGTEEPITDLDLDTRDKNKTVVCLSGW